ncbi:MAG: redoxin domain-containing protein, partial [Simkania sp.]|nr:redoxin domain-containing protein [Simkania sp.]
MSSLLVGKKAPQFKAKAVANGQFIDDFSLDMYTNKHVLLFFYPLDFTFVCPTELHAFQDRLQDFHARETEVVGC